MTDKKTPPQILFMMIKPKDLACFARDFKARYGPDNARIYLEWLLAKMKSVEKPVEDKPEAEPDEMEEIHCRDYNRGFEDGRKDVNEIKLNWDVFCEIAGLKPMPIVGNNGSEDTFEYAAIKRDGPIVINSSKNIDSDTERMRLIIEKINRWWFETGVQKGIKHESQFRKVVDLPGPGNQIDLGSCTIGPMETPGIHFESSTGPKEEIPTNAQLFRYLVRYFGKDCIETEYIRDNINIYELRSSPKGRGEKIICLARKGKMKLSRWQKIQQPFLTIHGCDLSKAHEIDMDPEIGTVEGSK